MRIRYKSWGGVREESKVIKYLADKWCKDNGYPIQTRRYVNKGKMKKVPKLDFLEEAEKEKEELNGSHKESVRQANERK